MACSTDLHEKKACCAPAADAREARPSAAEVPSSSANEVGSCLDRMVSLPGGRFLMGTEASTFADDGEGPIREITLSSFWLDRYPVTNALFARFVEATGYKTEAEVFGWSFVFWSHIPKKRFQELVEDTAAAAPWWCKVSGACWRAPEGPGSDLDVRADHPVIHVSWNDAMAFFAWSKQRLPTEAEWEYAARGGLVQKLYPWGDKLRPNGEHRCNIWQGEFPKVDTADDGFAGTCPVDAFAPNGFGLFSITGNAWEWCADWFDTTFHQTGPSQDPAGPCKGTTRVMKGGSFLCHNSYCNRYRVAARSSNTPDSSSSNVGFRCAL